MTQDELLIAARLTLGDTAEPYMWSDDELTLYLEDAEQEAAERADLLESDGIATYCTISVVAGTPTYQTNPLVYEVERARIAGESRFLKRTSRDKLDITSPVWEDETGTPREYYLNGNSLRLVPNPSVNGTLNLVVLRLPVSPMGASPEINVKHHRRMLDWVYRQAYLKRDADTYNETESLKYERMFTASFGERKDAKLHTRQMKHTPIEMVDLW